MDKRISVTKWGNIQTDRHTKVLKLPEIMHRHPQNIFRIFEKDSSSRTGYINDNLFSVRKWGNEHTDRHARNMKLFETNIQTSPEYI